MTEIEPPPDPAVLAELAERAEALVADEHDEDMAVSLGHKVAEHWPAILAALHQAAGPVTMTDAMVLALRDAMYRRLRPGAARGVGVVESLTAIETMILAEIADPKSTRRSVGVLYAVLIGFVGGHDFDWGPVNRAIKDRFGGPWNGPTDKVKAIGWRLYERTVDRLPAPPQAEAGS